MRVVVLGSGTSAGVPTLGCGCAVCTSPDPHNRRMRASIYIEHEGLRLLVDCGTDFRSQALANGIHDVDAVLLTHTHSDHVNGLDDLRAYNMVHKHPIDVYATRSSLDDIRTRFAYCFQPPPTGGGIPELHLSEIAPGNPLRIRSLGILPLNILHGKAQILGFRFGSFAYITDASTIPEETFAAIRGVEVLITSALRHRPHPTHMSLSQAVEVAERVGARRTWFTHMSHDLEHQATNASLPQNVRLAYDGLSFEVS
jgi:phosphoribosyl 1,2-cyclic phosphate phosphodiesterase